MFIETLYPSGVQTPYLSWVAPIVTTALANGTVPGCRCTIYTGRVIRSGKLFAEVIDSCVHHTLSFRHPSLTPVHTTTEQKLRPIGGLTVRQMPIIIVTAACSFRSNSVHRQLFPIWLFRTLSSALLKGSVRGAVAERNRCLGHHFLDYVIRRSPGVIGQSRALQCDQSCCEARVAARSRYKIVIRCMSRNNYSARWCRPISLRMSRRRVALKKTRA